LKLWGIDEIKRDVDNFGDLSEPKWEEKGISHWDNDELLNTDFAPQKLRFDEMENSITPFSWDDPHPQRSYFDLL